MSSLKKIRTDMNLSQEAMAKKIGVTFSYYAQIERGTVRAAAGFIRKFKAAFPAISTDLFFTESR